MQPDLTCLQGFYGWAHATSAGKGGLELLFLIRTAAGNFMGVCQGQLGSDSSSLLKNLSPVFNSDSVSPSVLALRLWLLKKNGDGVSDTQGANHVRVKRGEGTSGQVKRGDQLRTQDEAGLQHVR